MAQLPGGSFYLALQEGTLGLSGEKGAGKEGVDNREGQAKMSGTMFVKQTR